MTEEETLAALKRLREPFKSEEIGKKPKLNCRACSNSQDKCCDKHTKRNCKTCGNYISEKHIHLDFVGHAHVRERLLEVDPLWNWEPMGLTAAGTPHLDDNGGLWILLTIAGVTRKGYGDAEGKRGPAATKEAIGDAIRNAGQSFGIALDLWKGEPAATPAEVVAESVLTPEQRANEMRNVILALGKKKRMGLPAIDGDFNAWARGEMEFRTADEESLVGYKAYLEAVK